MSVDLARIMLKYASSSDPESRRALIAAGIDASILNEPGARIPVHQFEAMWASIPPADNDPLIGLHFGEAFGGLMEGHFLYALMMNRSTIGKALETFFRYHNLMSDMLQPKLITKGKTARIIMSGYLPHLPLRRHLAEASASMIASLLRKLSEDRVSFSGVSFRHDRSCESHEYTRVFRSEVRFGADSDEILFNAEILAQPLLFADPGVSTVLARYAEGLQERLFSPHRHTQRALSLISGALTAGHDYSLPSIAGSFDLSARRLQNLLKQEGSSYRDLLDRVRRETALQYLLDRDISLCDIAFILGFSEQSAFNHAFRKWTGLTPTEYRKKHDGASNET